jgi:hypothetical protein
VFWVVGTFTDAGLNTSQALPRGPELLQPANITQLIKARAAIFMAKLLIQKSYPPFSDHR